MALGKTFIATALLAIVASAPLSGSAETLTAKVPNGRSAASYGNFGTYNVPKGEMLVEVYMMVEPGGAEGLVIAGGQPHAAPGETLNVGAAFSGLSKDKYKVETEPGTNFLKRIEVNLEDKTGETLTALGSSAGSIWSLGSHNLLYSKSTGHEAAKGDQPDLTLIGSVTLDPTDASDVVRANQALWASITTYANWLRASADCNKKRKKDEAAPDGCKFVAALDNTRALASRPALIQVPAAGTAITSCKDLLSMRGARGICVRASRQVAISLNPGIGANMTGTAYLPISNDVGLFDIRRALFATKSATVDFVQGGATTRESEQTSAALAIANVPKNVVGAFISAAKDTTNALAELIQLRVNFRSKADALKTKKTSTETKETTTTDDKGNTETKTDTTTNETEKQNTDTPAETPEEKQADEESKDKTAQEAADGDKPVKPDPTASANANSKLWLFACSYGLKSCSGAFQAQLLGGGAGGTSSQIPDPGKGGTGGKNDHPTDPACVTNPNAEGCE